MNQETALRVRPVHCSAVLLPFAGRRTEWRLSSEMHTTIQFVHHRATDGILRDVMQAIRQATCIFGLSIRLSVCPSVRMEKRGSYWMDFHGISYFSIFRTFVDTIPVPLYSNNKNSLHFTCRPIYSFDHISLSSSQNEKCCRQTLNRKSKHTFCVP